MKRAVPFACVAAVALASVLPAPHALLWPDTVRDLAASLAFARGEALPLAGPAINLGPPLGPVWIWLQALPIVFVPTFVAASVFVAAVAALKFPLLYWLGNALSGSRLGLALVAASAFPSIAAYQWMVFFHPNWVEAAATLVLLLVALAARRRSMALAYGSALALGFAVQMHPTALFYAPFVAFAFLAAGAGGLRLAGHGLAAALLVLAWFAPVLVAGDMAQVQKLGDVSSRVGAGLASFSVVEALVVMRTAYFDVPVAVGATHAAALGIPTAIWNAALAIVGAAAVAGLVLTLARPDPRRGTAALLLSLLVAGWVAAAAVRSYTPFYLCYFLLPLSALVFGLGLDRLAASAWPAARTWGLAAIGLAIVAFLAAAAGARAVGRSGEMVSRLPALGDLKHPGQAMRAGLATATARDAAARHLCRLTPPPVLHGELAFSYAASAGLDTRLHCPGRKAEPRLLGAADGHGGLATIALAQARALSRTPGEHFRGIAGFPATAIHPTQSRPVERDWHYFEVLRDRVPVTPVVLEFSTGPGTHLVIYRMKPFDSVWRALRVTRDSAAATAALSTYNSDVFASGAAASTRWRVEFETDAPQWVDVYAF